MAKTKPFEFEDVTDSLTDRQMYFCMLYVGECKFNGSKSAIEAGYSEKGAKEQASYLLTNPNIQKYIKELKNDLGLRCGITAEDIAKEFKKVGFSNIQDYIEGGNSVLDLSSIERDKAAAIASVKTTVTESEVFGTKTVTEFKLADKLKALSDLNVMLGYNKPTEQKIEVKLGKDLADESYT